MNPSLSNNPGRPERLPIKARATSLELTKALRKHSGNLSIGEKTEIESKSMGSKRCSTVFFVNKKDNISDLSASTFNSARTTDTADTADTTDTTDTTDTAKSSTPSTPPPYQVSLSAVDVAALVHIVEWAESAERVKRIIKGQDSENIQGMCCCCRCCLQKLCPGFTCCDQGPKPEYTKVTKWSDYVFIRKVEAQYAVCCCRCPLTILTSLFVWWDMPVGVVKLRLLLLGQIFMQVLTTVFQWVFLYELIQIETTNRADKHRNDMSSSFSSSTMRATIAMMIVPELAHAVYMCYTPGYNLRSRKRMWLQVFYSLFAQCFVRPVYDLAWSFKWTGLMPYVSLQNEGDLVTDSGMHERYIVWAGLAASLREIPLNIIKAYILAEYWMLWRVTGGNLNAANITSVIDTAFKGGTLRHCTTGVNEWAVLFSMFLGLFVSALTLSDQLERQVPYGAFPKRFSTVLRGEDTKVVWTVLLLLVFFVDLFLRFAIIIPVVTINGLRAGMAIMMFFLAQSIFFVWFWLSDSTCSSTMMCGEMREDTEEGDNYDDGILLEGLSQQTELRCCFGCLNVGKIVETAPFCFWSMWVDLPIRLKWLSVLSGQQHARVISVCGIKIAASLMYYLCTNVGTMIIVGVAFDFNRRGLREAWKSGSSDGSNIRCNRTISIACADAMYFDKSTTWCPANYSEIGGGWANIDFKSKPSIEANTSWMMGCTTLDSLSNSTEVCMPELKYKSNHVSIDVLRFSYSQHEANSKNFSLYNMLIVCIILKLTLCLLVAQQFYGASAKNHGRCCCTVAGNDDDEATDDDDEATDDIDNVVTTDEHPDTQKNKRRKPPKRHSSVFNRDERLKRMATLHADLNNWTSYLRSRDIQLMLRVSRMMPNVQRFETQDDEYQMMRIAKHLLGTGGDNSGSDMTLMQNLEAEHDTYYQERASGSLIVKSDSLAREESNEEQRLSERLALRKRRLSTTVHQLFIFHEKQNSMTNKTTFRCEPTIKDDDDFDETEDELVL